MEKRPFNAAQERIRSDFLATGDEVRALAERTACVDRLVLETACSGLLRSAPQRVSVLAVGGYGRRQLFPYSDVDLLLLFDNERLIEIQRGAIAAFIQELWDAGLRVSHSVRTPAECTELHDRNVELNVSLLDQRYVCGDRALYASVAERLPRFVQAQRDGLVRNLARLTRQRHCKFQDTYYHLEPDIKEAPGGLRDFQLLRWLEQMRHGSAEAAPELREAWSFLARLRCLLHCMAGRDANLLTFDAQETAAERWHDGDSGRWMRAHFRHARAIYTAAERALEAAEGHDSGLLAQFRDWRSRVSNSDFSVSQERVNLRAPQQLDADPGLLPRLFEFVARHGLPLSADTERRIAGRQLQADWRGLAEALSLPHAPMALRAMHETGALGTLFPELEHIDCLVIRDFYHRYTVDEHTLLAIEKLCSLRAAARNGFSELFAEIASPAPLIFALLFHDAGKGVAGEGPVDASLRLVEGAMARLKMPAPDCELVRFLIERHLVLSAAMSSRDLSDPAATRELAHIVQTVERLKALTLVTWADIGAVNPTAMTPWRAGQLWQVYLRVHNELTRELNAERIEAAPEDQEFLEGFPTRYLRTHSREDIRDHIALEEKSRARGVAAELKRTGAVWILTVVGADRPFLFASLAGTLAAFGMNILKAEAFANRRGTVLDSFAFDDPIRTLELNPSEIDRLRATVERVMLGRVNVEQLLEKRPRPAPPSRKARVRPVVAFDPDASDSATLIQVIAEDRPGLLYDLASAISSRGGNIEVVLIDTEAHKAIDVFYVTKDGGKLGPSDQEDIGRTMRAAVGIMDEAG